MYANRLFIEFLMFSDDIEKELDDFKDVGIDIDVIHEIIEDIKTENIYTEKNLNNLKIILKNLNIKKDDEMKLIIDNVKPSNDIYYYEYLEKFNALNRSIDEQYICVSKKMLEDSIRYDFIAFCTLKSKQKHYNLLSQQFLINSKLFPLFVKKILNEQPDLLLNKTFYKRINEVLNTYNEEELKKEIKYFRKNKYAQIFDYEKFKYYYNNAFFKYIITNKVDIKKYHNYIISDEFIYYLNDEILKYDYEEYKNKFPYTDEMKLRIKKILKYILDYRQDFDYKEKYNILKYKLDIQEQKIDFYINEYMNKVPFIEFLTRKYFSENNVKYILKKEYEIFNIYTLSDEKFKNEIQNINKYRFINLLNRMLINDPNFLNNKMIRKRTEYILNNIELKEVKKDKEKILNKIKKINKELE